MTEPTFSTYDEVEAYVRSQPTGDAPASRYGVKPMHWEPVAIAAATIMAGETGDMTPEGIDHVIGLVVNDHDDIEYLIREYGAEYGFNPEDYLD